MWHFLKKTEYSVTDCHVLTDIDTTTDPIEYHFKNITDSSDTPTVTLINGTTSGRDGYVHLKGQFTISLPVGE